MVAFSWLVLFLLVYGATHFPKTKRLIDYEPKLIIAGLPGTGKSYFALMVSAYSGAQKRRNL